MRKVRLTESQLHRVIKESVKKILRENEGSIFNSDNEKWKNDYDSAKQILDRDYPDYPDDEVADIAKGDRYANLYLRTQKNKIRQRFPYEKKDSHREGNGVDKRNYDSLAHGSQRIINLRADIEDRKRKKNTVTGH